MNTNSYRLTNSAFSEIPTGLPLPHLPLCFGFGTDGSDYEFPCTGALNDPLLFSRASKMAQLLRATDISYLSLREDSRSDTASLLGEPTTLISTVLQQDSKAFDCTVSGPFRDLSWHTFSPDKRSFQRSSYGQTQSRSISRGSLSSPREASTLVSSSGKKSKMKRKHSMIEEDGKENSDSAQDGSLEAFCDLLDDYLQKTEIPGENEGEEEGVLLPLSDLKQLSNEISSAHSKNMLHHIPVESLLRLLILLDRHLQRGHDIIIDDDDDVDSENFYVVMCSLEAVHISLTIMTHQEMPKQVYNEEIIDRIINFSRNQILQNVFAVYDPSYRNIYKSKAGTTYKDEDDGYDDTEYDTSRKTRRKNKQLNPRRASLSKVSSTVSMIVQKLCTILGLLKELVLVERLLDSSVLLLIKTSLTTLSVDNIHLLQLKAIGLICAVFSSYFQHRTIIMDELFILLWKLPSSKRNLRCYHLPDEEQKQIQMITALIVQIVQCSVSLPDASEGTNDSVEASSQLSDPKKCFEATEFCLRFWTTVLQRCASVKTQDGSEIKGVVENIVADLLSILNVPEYPASGFLLQALCCMLFGEVGLKSKDAVVRSMAIDLLGQIAARLKHDAVLYKKDKLWILQELYDDNRSDAVPKDVCASCLEPKVSRPSIHCNECNKLFHGECIGFSSLDVAHGWICHCCICRRQLSFIINNRMVNESKLSNVDQNLKPTVKRSAQITGVDVMQQIILNYLQDSGLTDDTPKYAGRFYVWQWYKDDPNGSKLLSYYYGRLALKSICQDHGVASIPLSRNMISRIAAALGQQRKLARGFDKILEILLMNLQEHAPTPRAKALRAVSAIVEVDPEVLGYERVRLAVEGRFLDSAISVREAAMELVGRHIASHPDVAVQYLDKVAERIMDTGVSVRKRVIKIIRDMCMSKCNIKEATSACVHLISRINDEESSIQDLVCRTFYELWFEDSIDMQMDNTSGKCLVPSKIAERTEQLVDVLRRLQNHQQLVTIIKRSLALDFCPQNARSAGLNPSSQSAVRSCCELMCSCLLERILQAEEANNNDSDTRTLPYILALHAFCTVDPTLCAPTSDPSRFVITLQPYLKNQHDNRDAAQLLQSIVFVIDAVLPLVRRPAPNFVEELEQDLKQIIRCHSFLTVASACIKCLCTLKRYASHSVSSFEHLSRLFYRVLERYRNGLEDKDKLVVPRALFCLGLLVRHGACFMVAQDKETSIGEIVTLFKHYLRSSDFNIKVRSLQALGFVFVARPEFMMEKDVGKIIEATLSVGSDPDIKMQTLRSLCDCLIDNEEQMQKNDNGISQQSSAGAVPAAAGAGDNNFCGGIIQLHWNSILERCLDMNDQVRQSALKVVDIVLRQGLVHPITCVPYLIALEVDQHESNSKLAHRLLIQMNEKYPTFFESRLGDGLQLSFRFIQSGASVGPKMTASKVSGTVKFKQDASISTAAKGGISRIYKLIKGSRVSRNKFLSSIIRKFDFSGWSCSPIPFLVYCAEILAALPFTLPDEPLYIVYIINRIVQVRAGNLESEMKALIADTSSGATVNGSSGPRSDETFVEGLGASDFKQMLHVDDGSVGESDITGITDVQSQKMKAGCHAAIAMVLLLKLKRHLKIVYSLNDARCQAFSPTEPIKAGETISRQSIPFSIKDIPVAIPTSVNEMLQQYQEFKKLLKEDAFDYTVHSANTPRKRARPPSANTPGIRNAPSNGHASIRTTRTKTGLSSSINGNVGLDKSEDEEEYDDDDDYDWTGQTRRQRHSSGKGQGKKQFLSDCG